MDNQELRQRIINHLVGKYSPEGIILHGSRARNVSRINSDWDIYVLVSAPMVGNTEVFEGQQLDVDIVQIPLKENEIIKTFGGQLREAEVLYDMNDRARALLNQANAVYEKGCVLTIDERAARLRKLTRNLKRIEDWQRKPLIQFYYVGIFYDDAIRYWYELNNRWSEPAYIALPQIAKEDPNYYQLLEFLAKTSEGEKRATIAKQILEGLSV